MLTIRNTILSTLAILNQQYNLPTVRTTVMTTTGATDAQFREAFYIEWGDRKIAMPTKTTIVRIV